MKKYRIVNWGSFLAFISLTLLLIVTILANIQLAVLEVIE